MLIQTTKHKLLTCPGCKAELNHDTCWCGWAMDDHDPTCGHTPCPAGCTCGYWFNKAHNGEENP